MKQGLRQHASFFTIVLFHSLVSTPNCEFIGRAFLSFFSFIYDLSLLWNLVFMLVLWKPILFQFLLVKDVSFRWFPESYSNIDEETRLSSRRLGIHSTENRPFVETFFHSSTGTLVIQPAADKPSVQSSAVPLFLLFYEPSVSLWHPLPFSPINRLKVKDTAGKRSS